jgi:hypothetical protein
MEVVSLTPKAQELVIAIGAKIIYRNATYPIKEDICIVISPEAYHVLTNTVKKWKQCRTHDTRLEILGLRVFVNSSYRSIDMIQIEPLSDTLYSYCCEYIEDANAGHRK